MRYLSVCAGIEAATVAWHHMGWEPAGFSEIEKFPSLVLDHHYPQVPKLGDMTKYKEWNLGTVDLLVGGTPCQSFSVAGLRKGLADPRGNLALVYLGIADAYKPKWIVWENVPGVLSSNGGRDFGSFLGALAQLGYGFAYRVLDAQFFGVPQRRRRVFVVGCLGDWRPAAAVLFERTSVSRDTATSRKKRKEITGSPVPSVANCLTSRMHKGINTTVDEGQTPIVQPVYEMHGQDSRVKELWPVCSTVTGKYGTGGGNVPVTLMPISIQGNLIGREAGGPQGVGASDEGVMYTLTKADVHGVAQPVAVDVYNQAIDGQTAATLTEACGGSNTSGPKVMQSMAVRRLTPVECERLQGFPDGYTDIRPKGKDTPDGPRYKALGNSMAVPVMRWIGERINQKEKNS